MPSELIILGCGSSAGVPRLGGGWGACNAKNPKNRRRRCSVLFQQKSATGTTSVLVDTSPDVREQLLDAQVTHLDALLYTHAHADHCHGIDDIRPLVQHMKRRLDAYMDEPTHRALMARFGYAFHTPEGSDYPPILNAHRLQAGTPIHVEGAGGRMTIQPFEQQHGKGVVSMGFRVGRVAYSTDLNGFPEASFAALEDLDIWVLDCLRYTTHPSHLSLDEALQWIERFAPKRAILTDLHTDLDYDELKARLPAGVEPAYDGMCLTF